MIAQTERVMERYETKQAPRLPHLESLPASFDLIARGGIPTADVDHLQELLDGTQAAAEAAVCPDVARPGFYDIVSAGRTFFIYVYPSGRKVMLLAVWRLEA